MMHIEVNTRVTIRPHANYKGKYTNEQGIVLRAYKEMVGVKLDNHTNKSSTYGVFWFKPTEVDIIESEEIIMCENYSVVAVQFLDGSNTDKKYMYALYDDTIVEGDLVVVKTGHHGLAVAKVVAFEGNKPGTVCCGREIICKVDMTAYEARKQKAQMMTDLKNRMDVKVQQLQQTALYELLSEKDPELATMLAEYKSLLG